MLPSPAPAQPGSSSRRNSEISGDTSARAAIFNVSNTDQDDVDAARRGVADAFARLFDRHAPLVLALCRTQFPPPATDADDALQESFIRAFRMLDRLDQPAAFRPWLHAIARNVCAERRRSAARRRRHEESLAQDAASNGELRSQDRHHDATHDEDARRLDDALRQLPEPLRLAIHLHYLHNDPATVAATLGLSRSAYYKRLAQARGQLAALMSGAPTP